MRTVTILKTPNADTRSLKELDKTLVYNDTIDHIVAVVNVMDAFADYIRQQSFAHDHTKIESFDDFFADISTKKTGTEFKALPWWKLHLEERHHLNDSCPDDVNLVDVIEMLIDCVCAGKARSGEVYPVEISNDILQKAVVNTVELLKSKIKVVVE